MKIKRYLGVLSLAGVIFAAAGCTANFAERNTNPDEATDEHLTYDDYMFSAFRYMVKNTIPVFQLVGENEYGSASYQVIEDLAGNIFAGYTGVTNASFTANNLYDITAKDWYNAMFDDAYTRAMSGFNELEALREEYPQRVALADIVKVMVMHRVTDTYGPIPYLSIGSGQIQNDYDSQEEVYKKLFEDLGEAIDLLTDFHQANSSNKLLERFDDVFYGDVGKWIKFANTLRLRLAIRVRYADSNLAKEQAELAVSNPVGLMTATGDLARINKQGTSWENPLYMIFVDFNGGDSRIGATLASYMNAYKDTRRTKYFTNLAVNGDCIGVRNGINQTSTYASSAQELCSSITVTKDDGMLWMTPAEAYFLRAEAVLAGLISDANGTARELYEQGIRVSFDTHGLSSDAAAYIANNASVATITYTDVVESSNSTTILGAPSVAWNDGDGDEVNLERIITQKYIAMFPLGQEAWSEFRRTGYPRVIPVKQNSSGGVIDTNTQIRRLNFPDSEYTTNNAAVQKAITVLNSESSYVSGSGDNGGTKLWWDKK